MPNERNLISSTGVVVQLSSSDVLWLPPRLPQSILCDISRRANTRRSVKCSSTKKKQNSHYEPQKLNAQAEPADGSCRNGKVLRSMSSENAFASRTLWIIVTDMWEIYSTSFRCASGLDYEFYARRSEGVWCLVVVGVGKGNEKRSLVTWLIAGIFQGGLRSQECSDEKGSQQQSAL